MLPGSLELRRFANERADVVMYGHTHQQTAEWIGDTLVINPGSAGDARDNRNGRKLSCAILDLSQGEVQIIDYLV